MKTITIDRATWVRGGRKMKLSMAGTTMLLNSRGMKCCLGFHASQSGFSDDRLRFRGKPSELTSILIGLSEDHIGLFYRDNTDFSNAAMIINDDWRLTERQRERKLKTLARKHGFRYVFTGKTPREYWNRSK